MKKGVKIFGITLLVLLLIIFALPIVFKKQISEGVKQEINSQINGQVDYSDLSFSFFSHFPNATISLHNFSLTGQPPASNKIASVKELSVTVDLGSLISGHNYKVISIFISGADFNLKVTDDGRPDWKVLKYDVDFSKASKPEPGQPQADFSLQVNNWKIERTNIVFANDTARTYFELKGLNATGTQALDKYVMKLQSSTTADELSYTAGGIRYLASARLNADVHFSAEPSTGLYTFKDNVIQLNDLHLKLDGTVKNGSEGQDFNLKVQSTDTAFNSLLSIVPLLSHNDSVRLNTSGNFAFSTTISGPYHQNQFPAIKVEMTVTNGTLNQSGLPVAMKNISMMASVTKSEGPLDSTVIEVSRLYFETGKHSMNAKVLITTPVSNANIEAQVEGSIDPTIIPGLTPNETDLYSGIRVNLKISASKNDVTGKNYKGTQATGGITLLNCSFKTAEMPMAISIGEADCSLDNGLVVLNKFAASINRYSFNGSGSIDHLLPWLSHQSHLAIALNLHADVLPINELVYEHKPVINAAKAQVTATPGAVNNKNNASGDVDILVNATIKSATYNQLVLSNLTGQVKVSGDNISIDKAAAGLAGGNVSLNAGSPHIGNAAPVVNFNIGFANISMQQVNKALKQGGIDVSALQNISGNFSGELNGNGMLNGDKSPNYRSIHADGKTTCPDLKIDELPVLMDIARMAKVKSFEHMEAKNVQCNFHFNNGKTTVDPTDIKFTTGTNINFKGICDAAQNVDADITLDVPVREFGQVGSLAQSLLGSFMKVPENMQFKFKITGPMNKPAVRVTGIGPSDN